MNLKRLFLFSCLLLSACAADIEKDIVSVQILSENEEIPLDTTFIFNLDERKVTVDVLYPDSNWIGTIILLQGWNFPKTDWSDSTTLCEKALKEGYALVCPDMGKSIYALRTYPETRKDWVSYPTRSWVNNELIPFLQEREILSSNRFNASIGLSTGARGSFFLALDHPELFDAVACLSGDYDQLEVPNDNLYRGFFGSISNFPERWSGEENPVQSIRRLKSAVYLAHGMKDEVVDPSHTANLIDIIQEVPVIHSMKRDAGHDYNFWNSQVDPILDYFRKVRSAIIQ